LKAAFPKNDKSESVIDMLLEKASLKGHVTLEDLEEIIPRSGASVERIEEMVGILNRQGVRVVFPEKTEVLSANGFSNEDEEEIDQAADEVVVAGVEKVASDDTITLYLREMSKVPLLKKEQEVSLAKRYEAGRAAKEELIRMGKNNLPEKRKLLEEITEDGLLAREHLIKANTRLVVSVAKRYNKRGVPFLDLIQEGNLGLMKAVEKFDHSRGFRFSTYATWWIRQTITRAIADQGRTIRVPVHMVDRIRIMYTCAYG
jgi:RNA polymerase primary sigma factor